MVRLIHADGFFPAGDPEKYVAIVDGLSFVEKPYGLELENFNMILPGVEPILSKVLGERVVVDHKRSGVFRRPRNHCIMFENFESLNEWCFIVALEDSVLNLWYHISDPSRGEVSPIDARTALDGYEFNYRNWFEWKIHTNIILEPNNGVFIRPWVFHSMQDGLVQYYRLITDRKFRILITGLPGSNRDMISKTLHQRIPNSKLLKSKIIREESKDIDFTNDGRMRHVHRMLTMARNSREDCVIIDMVCPLQEMREILNPDIIIWANDIDSCEYEEVNRSFVPPILYDVRCRSFSDALMDEIIEKIQSKRT